MTHSRITVENTTKISWKSWKVMEKCLALYLQYLVPHSECSLQLVPKGFMLFQRHSRERLVLCSRPLQSSGSGSESTCGGNRRRLLWAAGTANERDPGRVSWSYLDGTDERQKQRDQDDPFLKSPHDVSTPATALRLLKPLIVLGGVGTLAASWFIPLFVP